MDDKRARQNDTTEIVCMEVKWQLPSSIVAAEEDKRPFRAVGSHFISESVRKAREPPGDGVCASTELAPFGAIPSASTTTDHVIRFALIRSSSSRTLFSNP